MRAFRLIASALPALVLVSCTATPTTRNADGPVDEPLPATTTTAPSLPPRPREVPLDDVDPCAVLTPEQRTALSLDNPPSPYLETTFGNAKACTMRSNISGNVVRLALVVVEGARIWLTEDAQVDAELTLVAGFPALVVRTPSMDDVCNVEVDVADGQFLDVMFRDGGNATKLGQDVLCLGAQRAAEAAMASLLQQR